MDLLLGNFVKNNIDTLNDIELKYLEEFLLIEDEILYDWYFHKKENLEKIINNQGIDFNKPQISFCNAGLESSIVWFALSEILKNLPDFK